MSVPFLFLGSCNEKGIASHGCVVQVRKMCVQELCKNRIEIFLKIFSRFQGF